MSTERLDDEARRETELAIGAGQGEPARGGRNDRAVQAGGTHLFRQNGGYAAQGTGFYVWDRDPAEVIRVAEALLAGRFDGSQSARYLVIEDPALLNV